MNLKKEKEMLAQQLKLDLLMVNGKLFKIGVNVLLHVEEENNFYKELVFHLKMEESHVQVKKLKKKLVTHNHVHQLEDL
jgi:hypothetical protein